MQWSLQAPSNGWEPSRTICGERGAAMNTVEAL
jgi:hypothetical protein